jgi:PAS domain S-box-containing protein
MVTDITERKQAEDRLKFTQTTVDKAALNIFWVDPETSEFTYANDAACSSLGYTREELMGMSVFQIDTEFNEEKFSGLMEVLQANSHVETESVHRTKDGRELKVLLSIVLTQLESRRLIAVFARDQTEKKRAEEALTKSEERSRLILNSAGEGIFGVDTEGRVIFINPGALHMLGFDEGELLGKKIHALIHHSHADGSTYPVETCPMYASYHAGTDKHIEDEVLWRRDGISFPVEYSSKPILRGDNVVGVVISFRDITDRLKSEQELKERLEELEQFNRLVVGRELKMIGLKEEVNRLLEKLGESEKYEIVQ